MQSELLGSDRVVLLLSLVPYLREHGPTPVAQLETVFGVEAEVLRQLLRFLGTAGVPGETLSYQHEDLFDIDWDALESEDIASLTRTVAVEETPRFAPSETAALVAGLHALTGILGPDDARLASKTAEKLAAVMGGGHEPRVTVASEPVDPRVTEILAAIDAGQRLHFAYQDAAGKQTTRTVDPAQLVQGPAAWYLTGYCYDRAASRTFRVDQISNIRLADQGSDAAEPRPQKLQPPELSLGQSQLGEPQPRQSQSRQSQSQPAVDSAHEPTAASSGIEIIARVREADLPRISGFQPEIIEEAEEGWLRVRVSAWYGAAATRLARAAPGAIVIEAPPAARETVAEWADRSLSAYDE